MGNITIACSHSSFSTPHIFLMGERGCGKTSLIYECIQHLAGSVKVGGFSTYFEERSPLEKILYISPFNCEKPVEPPLQKKAVMHWLSGSITVFQTGFDNYGSLLLQQSKKSNLIVMDELGRFEEECELFKREVFNCLNGDIPILGVIRKLDNKTWLDDVKSHPNVEVLDVCKENLDVIEKKLRQSLLNRFNDR